MMKSQETASDEATVERETRATVEAVVERIVAVADPERIILFGSTARKTLTPNSDLDFLVVKSGVHRRRLAQAIYRNLYGVNRAVDIVVVTPEDIERYADSPSLVIRPALQQGRVVYER